MQTTKKIGVITLGFMSLLYGGIILALSSSDIEKLINTRLVADQITPVNQAALDDLSYINNIITELTIDSIILDKKYVILKSLLDNARHMKLMNSYARIQIYLKPLVEELTKRFAILTKVPVDEIAKNRNTKIISGNLSELKSSALNKLDNEAKEFLVKERNYSDMDWEKLFGQWKAEAVAEVNKKNIMNEWQARADRIEKFNKDQKEREKKQKEEQEQLKLIKEAQEKINSIVEQLTNKVKTLSQQLQKSNLTKDELNRISKEFETLKNQRTSAHIINSIRESSPHLASILNREEIKNMFGTLSNRPQEKLSEMINAVESAILAAKEKITKEEKSKKEKEEQDRKNKEAAEKARKEQEEAKAKGPVALNAKIKSAFERLQKTLPAQKNPKKITGTTFELWNKAPKSGSPRGLRYAVQQASAPKLEELKKLEPNDKKQLSLDTTKYTNLLLEETPFIGSEKTYIAYLFAPGKTIYVRRADDQKTFGPQTGTWAGLSGKTDSGLSMKDNIEKEGKDYAKAIVEEIK